MASREDFFDPFVYEEIHQGDSHRPELGSPEYDFYTPSNGLQGAPGDVARRVPVGMPKPGHSSLRIKGQGTIAVRGAVENLLEIQVWMEDSQQRLNLLVSPSEFRIVCTRGPEAPWEIPVTFLKDEGVNACYLNKGEKTTYWLSLDKENGRIRYGKYYTNATLTLAEASLKTKDDKGVLVWKEPNRYNWLERLKPLSVTLDKGTTKPEIVVQPVAVVIKKSPFVVSTDKISLMDIERGAGTVPANLPLGCQTLYGNVAGVNIVLNDDKFPHFSEAIERSCRNPDGWCYKKLAEKAVPHESVSGQNFAHENPDMTYLRITIGENQGDSPGVPYVLEIWPSGHSSPIHDHGDACAIIKVLHGEIEATYYDSLSKLNPIGTANFSTGDITWIGPQDFQIHKLHNKSPRVCCTIQCYRYEKRDKVHYEYFNFADDNHQSKPFTPNSDMSFLDFRQVMMREWEEECRKFGNE